MFKKISIIGLSALTLLVTSYCVHMKEEDKRSISSTTLTDISNKVQPQVFTNKAGDQIFIYFQVDKDEDITTVQVQYQCAVSSKLGKKDWDIFNVAYYIGASALLNDREVRVRYYPIALLDFSLTGPLETEERVALDKVYDLKDACRSSHP